MQQSLSRNAARLSLTNIRCVEDPSLERILSTSLIISDNASTISAVATTANLNGRVLLGYFDESVEGNAALLYRLYVDFHIRRVAILPSFYFGY